MKPLTFSGIDLGLERAGMTCVAQMDLPLTSIESFAGIGGFSSPAITPIALIEKEPTCRAVLRRHHPHALILEDVRDAGAHNLPWANIHKFGFPCFPAGTLILTHAGLVPIEDVREGDLVLTHTGRWRPIIQTMRRMAPTIRLRGHGHPALVTTEEHPFWATSQVQQWVPRSPEHPNGTFRRDWRSPDWIAAKDMQGKYWASPTDFPAQGVPPFIRNLRERFVCEQNDAFFWIVGAWLGDGWLNMRQRAGRPDGQTAGQVFICTDHREVEELQRRLDAAGLTYTISPEQTTTKFIVSSRPLARWLHEHFGQYAHGKRVPAWALGMAEPLRAALLAGYTWADGSKLGDKTRATSISKGLLIGMKLLAQSLGYSVALHTYVTNRVAVIEGRIVVERPQWQLVSEERGKSSVVFGPHRFGRVRAVEPTGEIQEVFNIGVADDESYVADGIVVHNCQDLSVAGKRAGLAGGRSGLFFEAARITYELQPDYAIWENVPGLRTSCSCRRCRRHCNACGEIAGADETECLVCGSDELRGRVLRSHRGADFFTVISTLGYIGYFGCWTLFDAQYFGVAQRRQRLFGVFARHDLGVERCAKILSLATRLRGDFAPSSEARPDVAATIRTSSRGRNRGNVAAALNAHGHAMTTQQAAENGHLIVASTLNSAGNRGGFRTEPGEHLVAVSFAQSGVRRLTPTECERLQGFDDGHTAWGIDEQGQRVEMADSVRYRMCGNAVCKAVSSWLDTQILQYGYAKD